MTCKCPVMPISFFFGGTTQTNFICEMTSKCPVLPTRYFFVELLVMTRKCPVLRTRWFFVGTTWNNFSVCYISGFPDWISSYSSCKPDKGHWKCERCKYFAIKLLLQASVTNTKLTNLTNQQAMTSFKFFNISAYCGLWWWLAQFGLSWNHCLFLILWLVNFIHH